MATKPHALFKRRRGCGAVFHGDVDTNAPGVGVVLQKAKHCETLSSMHVGFSQIDFFLNFLWVAGRLKNKLLIATFTVRRLRRIGGDRELCVWLRAKGVLRAFVGDPPDGVRRIRAYACLLSSVCACVCCGCWMHQGLGLVGAAVEK